MIIKKITISSVLCYCFILQSFSFGSVVENSESDIQAYKQEMAKIRSIRKSLSPESLGSERPKRGEKINTRQFKDQRKKNDLGAFEKTADEIHDNWKNKDKKNHARLMLELCKPLSSGLFKDNRSHFLARKYALSALSNRGAISVFTEVELTGHVMTSTAAPGSPKGDQFSELRKKDVEVKLHAWRRLLDSVDPDWDPKEKIKSPNLVAIELGFLGTVNPESIEDPVLRQKYVSAIEANREKINKSVKQNKLRKLLERHPRRTESYIVHAYSKAPYDNEELTKFLDDYKIDTKTKARIINSVTKNIENQNKLPKIKRS